LFICLFVYFLQYQGFELMASLLLGRCSYHLTHSTYCVCVCVCVCFSVFEMGSGELFARAALNPPSHLCLPSS
jgi:hypothetical protein